MKQESDAREAPLLEQAERFDREAIDYDARHTDIALQEYRDRFYRQRLCDFDMQGTKVLDAMCATGIDTPFLIARGADVQGLDISKNCAAVYEKRFGKPCAVASIHETSFDDSSFDIVYVSGGLHHIAHLLDDAMAEIFRILKPGGIFCFTEPNADSWIDKVRKTWYSSSEKFGSTERALSYRHDLLPFLSMGFEEEDYFTGGNVAYMLIFQSHNITSSTSILQRLKRPAFLLERMIDKIPYSPSFFLSARWRKTRSA
ncbi:MAG: class I SAM-dependent methyltransferase [Rhizobiaceae bacterium]|uniref:class I SAM-dependent methyltransferase n=1 Tax=Parvibaculum sp. TaxID=2024848 RepID=UPI001B0D75F9|nr:class I SAM-dependent methyltransferase [Parvibaculum sp.]MBO6633374.1 class I SAM-dependent methyltransferase [Parvibaculum sp.]MBO6725843.1 class I SAM-dependent methyltransferase [Rhizobiaceae bacterium]